MNNTKNFDCVVKGVSQEENGSKIYQLSSVEKQRFNMSVAQVIPLSKKTDTEENKEYITITGIASSTSVDHYGTEMSFKALKEMASQIKKGIVILPRHESLTGSGLAEWDEVIGRTYDAEVTESDIAEPSIVNRKGFVLKVESRLYVDDTRTQALIKRLSRGEPIGQSIGGWFENVRVEEDKEGEIKRVIVEDVVLDHIAITRAPANPDSGGLSVMGIRSSIQSFLDRRNAMDLKTENTEEILGDTNIITETTIVEENRGATAIIDTTPLLVAAIGKEIEATGDAEADQSAVPFKLEYEAMKEEHESMKNKMEEMVAEFHKMKSDLKEYADKEKELKLDLNDEDTEEKEDHEEGAIADDEDHIEALEKDEEEDVEDLVEDELKSRTALPFHGDLPLAAEDVPWTFDTTTQDEVLGKGLDNWDRYRDAHVYMVKGADSETKSAYKLPIARMINNELMVVLKGVYAAMAALNGSRGGVDIPDNDRRKVYETLKKYYTKFGKFVPDLVELSEKLEQDPVAKLDRTTELNNSSIDIQPDSDTRSNKMKAEDIKTLIEQVTRSVVAELNTEKAGLKNDPVETLTPIPSIDEKPEIRSEAVSAAYGVKEPTLEELKARLERAEDTLSRVLDQPLRKGRHTSTTVRGIGSEVELDHLINSSEKEGNQSLATVLKRNKSHLLRDSDEVMPSTLNNHQLKQVLTRGLRAAFLDGLLGTPVEGWQ